MGRLGRSSLHVCVDATVPPLDMVIVMGCSATHLFVYGVSEDT